MGLPAALSLTESVAVRAAATVGVKVTLMVQFAPAATLVPQVLVCAKSPGLAPVTVILLMVSVEPPVFDRVTFLGGTSGVHLLIRKCRRCWRNTSNGAVPVPVPVRGDRLGLPAALSLTESVAGAGRRYGRCEGNADGAVCPGSDAGSASVSLRKVAWIGTRDGDTR